MIDGAAAFAFVKSSLTFAAPIPTSISINSEPLAEKNGTFASPATALARSVFPLPGCPKRSTHFGTRAPALENFVGFLRNSTISTSSSFASSMPATSANLVVLSFLLLSFPAWILNGNPPHFGLIIRKRKSATRRKKIIGRMFSMRSFDHTFCSSREELIAVLPVREIPRSFNDVVAGFCAENML